MKKIYYNLQYISYIITFVGILYLYKIRFDLKAPREVFSMEVQQQMVYTMLFLLNIIILVILLGSIVLRKSKVNATKFTFISTWLDNTYKAAADLFSKIPYIDHPISKLTRFLMKLYKTLPSIVWKILLIGPRILLILSFYYDILYLEQFYISYITLYLLLFPIGIKFAYYISKHYNELIEEEILLSLRHIDISKTHEKIMNGGEQDISDFVLTEYNTQFHSVEHVFDIKYIIYVENDYLYKIKQYLDLLNNLFLLLGIRLSYGLIFGYICYWYYF